MNRLRDALRNALPTGFLRICDSAEAFWISDAPRRLNGEALADCVEQAKRLGCVVSEQNGLLLITPNDERLKAYLAIDAPLKLPQDERLLPIYALARLLKAHPAAWEEQPRTALLALLKREGDPSLLAAECKRTLAECARRLRLRLPLPSAAVGWLSQQIIHANETEALQ